jgi:cytochrome P450
VDLADPAFHRDPYRFYAGLRERGPVFRGDRGQWVATGFAEVCSLLKDPRVSVAFPGVPGWREHRGATAVADGGRWMLLSDGEVHRALRRPASRFLSPRQVQRRQGSITDLVGRVLDGLPTRGPVDFAVDVAEPIVTAVARDVLGLPAGHDKRLTAWSTAIIRMADPLTPTPVRGAVDAAMAECRDFVERARRSGELDPDGLAARLLGEEGIGHEDATANTVLLLMAAVDTTVGQLCTALWHLLRHPDQLDALRSGYLDASGTVAELVRYDSPVQIVTRRVTSDITTSAGTMRPGQKLMLVIGAANRDPDRYADPDRLVVDRTGVEWLGFGAGPHFCVGAHLARLTLATTIGGFLRRFPHIRHTGDAPVWRPSVVARRLQSLPLILERT